VITASSGVNLNGMQMLYIQYHNYLKEIILCMIDLRYFQRYLVYMGYSYISGKFILVVHTFPIDLVVHLSMLKYAKTSF